MAGLPQIHGDQLCSAFLRTVSANVQKIPTADGSNLVSTSKATKNTTPGLTGLIPRSDRLVGQGASRWVLLVKVVGSWRGLLQQLSAAVACNTMSAKNNNSYVLAGASSRCTCELVKPDLDLEGRIAVLLIYLQVVLGNEGDLLVWRLSAEHVAYEPSGSLPLPTISSMWEDAGMHLPGFALTQAHVLESKGLPDVIVVGAGRVSVSATQRLGQPRPTC